MAENTGNAPSGPPSLVARGQAWAAAPAATAAAMAAAVGVPAASPSPAPASASAPGPAAIIPGVTVPGAPPAAPAPVKVEGVPPGLNPTQKAAWTAAILAGTTGTPPGSEAIFGMRPGIPFEQLNPIDQAIIQRQQTTAAAFELGKLATAKGEPLAEGALKALQLEAKVSGVVGKAAREMLGKITIPVQKPVTRLPSGKVTVVGGITRVKTRTGQTLWKEVKTPEGKGFISVGPTGIPIELAQAGVTLPPKTKVVKVVPGSYRLGFVGDVEDPVSGEYYSPEVLTQWAKEQGEDPKAALRLFREGGFALLVSTIRQRREESVATLQALEEKDLGTKEKGYDVGGALELGFSRAKLITAFGEKAVREAASRLREKPEAPTTQRPVVPPPVTKKTPITEDKRGIGEIMLSAIYTTARDVITTKYPSVASLIIKKATSEYAEAEALVREVMTKRYPSVARMTIDAALSALKKDHPSILDVVLREATEALSTKYPPVLQVVTERVVSSVDSRFPQLREDIKRAILTEYPSVAQVIISGIAGTDPRERDQVWAAVVKEATRWELIGGVETERIKKLLAGHPSVAELGRIPTGITKAAASRVFKRRYVSPELTPEEQQEVLQQMKGLVPVEYYPKKREDVEEDEPTGDPDEVRNSLAVAIDRILTENPTLTPEERAELVAETPEYQAFLASGLEYQNVLASGLVDASLEFMSDSLRELLSFGQLDTATYNQDNLSRQYDQQKAVMMATFKEDVPALRSLRDQGAFGSGARGERAYQDALRGVDQQRGVRDAVGRGDLSALGTLYDNGAFGTDREAYLSLVSYVQEGGRELSPITADDVKVVSESLGTKKQYILEILKQQPATLSLAKDIGIAMVPIYGTIYLWDKVGVGMKAFGIATDALMFVPFIGGVAAASKVAGGIGRGARIAAGLKAIPRIALAEVKAPYTALRHPVYTTKVTLNEIRNLGEWAFSKGKIPLNSVTLVHGTARLDSAIPGTPEGAMHVRDTLMQMAARGEKPVYTWGDKTYSLRETEFMREGGVVAAGPDMRWIETPGGAVVKVQTYPEGHPMAGQRIAEKERGFFVSNTALERFTTSSAFGLEKVGAATVEARLQTLTDAVNTAKASGETKKASQLQKLLDDYNNAIKTQSIRKLDKAEARIIAKLSEMADDEVATNINRLLKDASERYTIGDIKGSQEAMSEALAMQDTLKAGKPGFAIFSPEVYTGVTGARGAIPSGKVYPGVIFQPKIGEVWEIALAEVKSDKAAQLLKKAGDAKRLGQVAKSAKLTKEAEELLRGGRSGFKKVTTVEAELKYPELFRLPEMKSRFYTRSMGKKLWIFTDKPRSFKDVARAKLLAPIETIKNLYKPAISVQNLPLTGAQRLSKADELLRLADQLETARGAGLPDSIIADNLRRARLARLEAESLTKGVIGAKTTAAALRGAKAVDEVDEYIQAAKKAEALGDYVSADRLLSEADAVRAARLAGRVYTRESARYAGTVLGGITAGRVLGYRLGRTRASEFPRRLDIPPSLRRLDVLRPSGPTRVPVDKRRLPVDRVEPRPPARTAELTRIAELRSPDRVPREPRSPDGLRKPPRETPRKPIREPARETPRGEIPRETPRGEIPREPTRMKPPRKPREPIPPVIPPFIPSTEKISGKEARLPEGSLAWRQGAFWKWIPSQDFISGKKPRTLRKGITPMGALFTGLLKPQETIQMIGEPGAAVPDISIDLGIADIFIKDNAKKITYTGKGEQTDVGQRLDSPFTGMTVDGSAPKGHYYADEVHPKSSISRTDMDTEEPLRGGESELQGINRPQITEDTENMLEGEYFDEEEGWLEPPVARRPVNRPKMRKKAPRRRGDVPPQMGGMRA